MDGRRFDRLARLFASAASRRSALRAVAGLVTGGAAIAVLGDGGEAQREEKCPTRCSGRKGCCRAQKCCNGRCVRTTWNRKHCGACGNRCPAGQICFDGACACGNAPCGDACCDFEEACLDASSGSCGACPVGAGIDAPENESPCGLTFGEFSECMCVTSVNGVASCSSIYGFCVDCESDDQCSLAMGTQALCIPVGDECDRFNAQFACVEASCFGGGIPVAQGRAAIPGAGPYMRLRPERSRR